MLTRTANFVASDVELESNQPSRPRSRATLLAAGSLLLSAANPLVFADSFDDETTNSTTSGSQPSSELQEITVTAQRREERLQDVPVSVMAIGASDLQRSGITDVSELAQLAPSLTWAQEAAWAQPHLRGVGTTASGPGIENSVALYVDGVYYASMIGGNADFNSVKDVEVINGPQGTLFGRNATGGLIQIRTKDPSHVFGGTAGVGYGDYNTATAGLYVTGGLTDTLAADVAIDSRYQGDGYGHNITTGAEVSRTSNLFARSKWLYTPTDALKLTMAIDFGHVDFVPAVQGPPGTLPLGGGPELAPYDIIGPVNPGGIINAGGAALTADYAANLFHILSITAYRGLRSQTNEGNLSTTSNPDFYGGFSAIENHRQVSQEVQLASPGGGFVTLTAGLYYFHEFSEYDPAHLFGPLFAPVTDIYYYTKNTTDSYAGYAQSTFALRSDTHLTTGFRYTVEPRSIRVSNPVIIPGAGNVGPADTDGRRTFSSPSWRISLDHRFNEEVLGYVSYNRGFKSGGWNPAQLPAASFAPEKLDAYEIGIKANSADNRIRFNASPFLYKYKDMQVQSFQDAILLISNGASSQLYGIDLDSDLQLTHRLRLHLGATLLHSEFTSYPAARITSPAPGGGTDYGTGSAKGNRLPLAPNGVATMALDYAIPSSVGPFAFNATYSYNSGWFAEPDNRLKQPSYNLVDTRVSWTSPDGAYQVNMWGKNLGNTVYATSIFSQSQGDATEFAPPRTFGIGLKVTF